jgi:hypothetical protein
MNGYKQDDFVDNTGRVCDCLPHYLEAGDTESAFVRVFVDGAECVYCERADRIDGWADQLIPHPDHGNPYCLPDGRLARRRVFGKVEFRRVS